MEGAGAEGEEGMGAGAGARAGLYNSPGTVSTPEPIASFCISFMLNYRVFFFTGPPLKRQKYFPFINGTGTF